MVLRLVRFARTKDGVLGRLGRWCILEEEDFSNQRNISCIPPGTYLCKRRRYHRGGYETFEVTNVPNRTAILIHIGNTEEATEGCLLIGQTFGRLQVKDEDTGKAETKIAVLSSGVAFRAFMQSMVGVEEFNLEIVYFDDLP